VPSGSVTSPAACAGTARSRRSPAASSCRCRGFVPERRRPALCTRWRAGGPGEPSSPPGPDAPALGGYCSVTAWLLLVEVPAQGRKFGLSAVGAGSFGGCGGGLLVGAGSFGGCGGGLLVGAGAFGGCGGGLFVGVG